MTDAERYAISVRKVLVDDQELWRATVRELPDLAEFAETREEALDLVVDAIESLKASAAEEGRPFPEPIEDEEEYSGRVTLRMSKSMHRAAAQRAINEDVSLNSYIVECIALRSEADIRGGRPQELFSLTPYFDQSAQTLGQQFVSGVTASSLSNVMIVTSAAGSGMPQPDIDPQFTIGTAVLPWARSTIPDYPLERRRRA